MLPTAEQSAVFKQVLKKAPENHAIRRMAEEVRVSPEVEECFREVHEGHDHCNPGSYIAKRMNVKGEDPYA